jgi:hypothetical protein
MPPSMFSSTPARQGPRQASLFRQEAQPSEAQLTQPRRIKGFWRLGGAGAFTLAFMETPHGRMVGKDHGYALVYCIYK